MTSDNTRTLLEKLDELQSELVELAFVLDRRGRHEAADVATTASVRLGELRDEFFEAPPADFDPNVRTDPVRSLNQ